MYLDFEKEDGHCKNTAFRVTSRIVQQTKTCFSDTFRLLLQTLSSSLFVLSAHGFGKKVFLCIKVSHKVLEP